ncbi:MAG TPA: multifunctional oxoglutarate decarboxylase/oxoglutarate dehydrogenase thiamine pyrophosphate-binding subunit/dihydrolipoyllysine-residue succinyltransferase subunit [Mycobacteriales bacterium]|nr:multifunctional oxoglutarate decarboxylase/oxoglutarate dehydrogenase thiamine pyrophosphate-binding subunit/dihydrolipoyllysine-residue succinyltransferase subunit [Mycobacteriales bacterium]
MTAQSDSGPSTSAKADPLAGFGPNEWLVYEMYQQYLKDPESVDRAWWDFFADYAPGDEAGNGTAATAPSTGQQAAPSTPAPQPERAPASAGTEAARGSGSAAAAAPAGAPASRGSGVRANGATERGTSERDEAPAEPAPHVGGERDGGHAPEPQTAPVAAPVKTSQLRGAAARVVTNMEASLAVPTATSVRAIPAKLLIDNRTVVNNHLRRGRGGKVSFTHIIGFALVKAVREFPVMNRSFTEVDGKPAVLEPEHVNLGLAIDLPKSDGSRSLVVPSIKNAETLDFARFWAAYEDIIRKARGGKLTADDFAGTTISLTNPGTIGTVHSVPRLMSGQGAIIGVGAMEYPAEYQGAAEETLARLAVSKVMTLTSTYDHRIIQGAESGDFLRRMHQLLLGEDDFYDEIFASLRIPYEPIRWAADMAVTHDEEIGKPARVIELIHSYRVRGHLMADTNPLEFDLRRHPDLDVVTHGLTLWDLDREFPTGAFGEAIREQSGGKPFMKLREILGVLRDSYCRTVGIEYMHIQDPEQRKWIQDRVERHHESPDREEQLRILGKLNQAEAFETFLQTKYVGQKRFSLEGGESVIPLLDAVVSEAAHDDMDEVVIGMAHRGRLNVLTNIVGKSYAQVFREFEGNLDPRTAHGSGDVKYHLGAEGEYTALDGQKVKVSLTSNPSHLEAVDPVLEGIARAKQDLINRGATGFTVLPILIHGDAAFAGQGVVAETLNLSQLRGYRTGGSVHVVINNQVGFTTSPTSARSSVYSTDVARMIQAPIFHVNGDDPEAVVRVAQLAYEFRQAFKKDVVIDMLCYRRRGHSEVDEPSFTQPVMYDLIDAKRSVRKIYTEALIGRGDITVDEAEAALRDYQEQLERVFAETRDVSSAPPEEPQIAPDEQPVETAISPEVLKRIGESQVNVPDGFTVHPRLLPQLQKRAQMVSEGGVDWAMGETIAFGSLLLDGTPIRLAGQDSRRGTFGQRHAVLVDRRTAEEYTPLAHLGDEQAPFYVYDSLLSEFAAMGFEYGYSVARPEALVLWEAQFGDFANGAQSIVDEFISAGEAKWGQRSSVVLLLPHGYEGQGPDHSSARIERYLALSAEGNWTVALPSTPANYFHLLRRQALSGSRKPLVVFTPKSMLRLRAATSMPEDFTSGRWQPVLADPRAPQPESVRRVLLTTGKVFYDLDKQRDKQGHTDIAILRVEQLYPLPAEEIRQALSAYPADAELVWVQDEPANQGAWPFMALNLPEHLAGRPLRAATRPASASPAAGSLNHHEAEQAQLLDRVFG